MRATFLYGAGDVRVEDAPDPTIQHPTDAVVRVVRACVCGSDLHPYRSMQATVVGAPMGHEFLGVVEDVGADVVTVRPGDLVISPFAFQDNTCVYCREGVQTSCVHGGFFASGDVGGAQAEAIRVPQADGTLVKPGVALADTDDAMLASLLTLSDVFLTGHHAAHMGRVGPGRTVTVIGDGAVGLSAVLASKRLGADRIVLMGRHRSRTDLGVEFGATDVVAERGEEGVAKVLELTGGEGSHVVIEAVGLLPAYEQAYGLVRPGGTISRVGVPQYEEAPVGFRSLFGNNVTLNGGPAPVRAYIEDALPDVLSGRIDPGRVFDRTLALDDVSDAYRAMDTREALKVMLVP
ncbi:zinc-binding dehydrogenase [Cellulomonas sp. P22]|uniref:zinc-binding dehydrogenase n=1 Tax=Cellulomonas sp. P22 TaxID=3373189 RepID=UPI0037ADD9CE